MIVVAFLAGIGTCGLFHVVAAWLSSRPRRHRMTGNYFDARSHFRIVSRGPAPIVERSEELIARAARRMMREKNSAVDA